MAKTFANIEEVKNWTDEEITEYLYQFWGCKSLEFTGRFSSMTKNPEKYCGRIDRIYYDGKRLFYPSSDQRHRYSVSFSIYKQLNLTEGQDYSFSCVLADREYREKIGNMFLLNPINTSIHAIERYVSKVKVGSQNIIPYLFEAWGVTDTRFIGHYK